MPLALTIVSVFASVALLIAVLCYRRARRMERQHQRAGLAMACVVWQHGTRAGDGTIELVAPVSFPQRSFSIRTEFYETDAESTYARIYIRWEDDVRRLQRQMKPMKLDDDIQQALAPA